ncbi:MAG: hypothetical protein OYI31_08130 [Chloroflexota bacterium]|nr:hypothetical protein [Chloroflexota bacterium]MDE3268398.1 hypothetical protein [Chloroflexota bacterium]
MNMTEGALDLQQELEAEVRDFEIRMARLEGQLDEKRSLLARLRQFTHESPAPVEPPPVPSHSTAGTAIVASGAGRRTISALGRHHYEVSGLRFHNAGQMLDYLDVPHYFSRKYPKQGDAAAREVMRWAKRNPSLASTVTVVLSDGTRMGLDAAVSEIWP